MRLSQPIVVDAICGKHLDPQVEAPVQRPIHSATEKAPIKTHNGLIAKFGEHLVRPGHFSAEHGEALNVVQRFRQVADYSGEPIELDKAAWSVERADAFVAAVKARFL